MGRRRPLTLAALLALAPLSPGCTEDGRDQANSGAVGAYPDAFEADRGHYSVERENAVARILRADYGPGEASVMHAHPAYCFVFIDDGAWTIGAPDAPAVEMQAEAGQFGCDDGGVHEPGNLSGQRARVVVIELVEGARPGGRGLAGPDPVAVAPDHYEVLLETDAVRISRITYRAGDTAPEHGHPAHCVVWIDAGRMPGAPDPGTVECRLAQVHAPEVFERPVELLLIEFTGRAVA
jgi:hypothetical protein